MKLGELLAITQICYGIELELHETERDYGRVYYWDKDYIPKEYMDKEIMYVLPEFDASRRDAPSGLLYIAISGIDLPKKTVDNTNLYDPNPFD